MILATILTMAFLITANEQEAHTEQLIRHTSAYSDAMALHNYTSAFVNAQKAHFIATHQAKLHESDLFPYAHRYALAAFKFRDKSALPLLVKAITLHKKSLSYSDRQHGRLLVLAASEARQRSRPEDAYNFLRKAKELINTTPTEDQVLAALIDLELSYLHFEKGDLPRAEKFIEKAYNIIKTKPADITPLQIASAEMLLGDISLHQQRWAQTIIHFEAAYDIYKADSLNFNELNGEHNVTAAYILKRLVAAHHKMGNTKDAETAALEFAYTRKWEAGYLIYNPTEKTPFWLPSDRTKKEDKKAAGYIASYETTPSGRRKNVVIHMAKNIPAEEALLKFQQSYYVPKLENGKPVAGLGCDACQFHIRH